jgi:hypothetical protein
VPQIATLTGHGLKDVEAILDAHYLGRDVKLAEIGLRSSKPEQASQTAGLIAVRSKLNASFLLVGAQGLEPWTR